VVMLSINYNRLKKGS